MISYGKREEHQKGGIEYKGWRRTRCVSETRAMFEKKRT
jgi:hypothetical protein